MVYNRNWCNFICQLYFSNFFKKTINNSQRNYIDKNKGQYFIKKKKKPFLLNQQASEIDFSSRPMPHLLYSTLMNGILCKCFISVQILRVMWLHLMWNLNYTWINNWKWRTFDLAFSSPQEMGVTPKEDWNRYCDANFHNFIRLHSYFASPH